MQNDAKSLAKWAQMRKSNMATSLNPVTTSPTRRILSRLFAGCVAIVCLTVAGCAMLTPRLEAPYVSLAGLELKQVGVFEQRYDLTLRIQNPNAVSLPIAGMNYQLALNGKSFARGVSNDPVDIPGYGEALTRVQVTSNVVGLLDQLKQLGQKGEPSLDYKVTGNVSLANRMIDLPFTHEGSFKLNE